MPETHTITEEDLAELESINYQMLLAHQNQSTNSLFALYQRTKHIIVRTRGLLEE